MSEKIKVKKTLRIGKNTLIDILRKVGYAIPHKKDHEIDVIFAMLGVLKIEWDEEEDAKK